MPDKIKVLGIGLILSAFFLQAAWADSSELTILKEEFTQMQQKMEAMQRKIEQLEAGQSKVAQTVKEEVAKEVAEKGPSKLSWHGYFGWHFEDETRNTINPTFDAFQLALVSKVDIVEKMDLYSQFVYEHAPFYEISVSSAGARSLDARSSGEFTVNDAYVTYTIDEKLKLRAGKFATPFGFWNTLMYAAPTYVTLKQPGRDTFYDRGSDTELDAYFFGRYSMGAWLLGSYDIFSYDFYVVNGRTTFAQHKDDNRNKAIGARLGIDLSLGSSSLKLLYSRYQEELRASTTTPFFRQYTNALSLEWTINKFKLISEIEDSQRQGAGMTALYVLGQYNLTEKLVPFAQFQLHDPDKHAPKSKTSYITGGLAYQISPWRALLKFQVDRVLPDNAIENDYWRFLTGVAASF